MFHRLISAFYRKSGVPMVLNTSFNRKSQPIVETPSQAISTFLAAREGLNCLYIGQFKITHRIFPMEDVMNAMDSDTPIYGIPIYLSETTTSTSQPDVPVRVRVLDGSDDEKWREFPSLLHLEVLQSLQQSIDSADGAQTETTLGDLYAVFTSEELNGGSGYAWEDIAEVLRWLFSNNFVYFDTIDDDIDPADALKDLADIVDLR